MKLKAAIEDLKIRLRKNGYRTIKLQSGRPFHLLYFDLEGNPRLAAVCQYCHSKRKRKTLDRQDLAIRTEIFCYK